MLKRITLVLVFAISSLSQSQAAIADSTWHSDPPAVLLASGLFKNLNAYPNYGSLDGATDILYSTEFDSWYFRLSQNRPPSGLATVTLSLVLDDHYDRPESEYVGTVEINGVQVFSGAFASLGVHHGQPFGARFRNWTKVSFSFDNSETDTVTITIHNDTPSAGDWLAIDSMTLGLAM